MGHSNPASAQGFACSGIHRDRNIVDLSADPRFSEVSAAVVEHLPHLRASTGRLRPARIRPMIWSSEAVAAGSGRRASIPPRHQLQSLDLHHLAQRLLHRGPQALEPHRSRSTMLVSNQPSIGPTQEDSLAFCDFRRAFIQFPPCQREVLMLIGNGDLQLL